MNFPCLTHYSLYCHTAAAETETADKDKNVGLLILLKKYFHIHYEHFLIL